ncbi:cobyrinate a,c-diamide synthase [Puia dinghuensis]|uniref:Cobyrinate a,c-diamide synthase n=1 Tax=Puia dinghuensis TaxID=1792502 RepID=A0A8J2UBK5_9BACT|nr:cobyrinate a,c-diamide synthase [Puia dinghuensis]GGA94362.1 cobyrinic acid a,c-diamide synthase [Puia dinghuensis]
MQSQFLLAAPHSGAGKTTVTLGLLRALQQRGLRVQPFKCGPDYIDPIHHHTAAGRDSINLDLLMMSAAHIRQLYQHYTSNADVAITEGVMGLFDGARKREGSSADLARLLDLPVILVLNAKAMAYTAAALLYGLKNFDPALNIAGVIFNFVDSPIHYKMLQEASEAVGIKALGHLPANNALHIPSRHLGLDTAEAGVAIETAARHIEKHLDLDAILAATTAATQLTLTADIPTRPSEAKTILVARDPAFLFLYPENLRRLEAYGTIHYFSPLHIAHLPPADLLYLPGGYPECYLEQLSQNKTLLQDIQTFTTKGGKVLAECGGMMLLGKAIIDESGKSWPMTGVLDIVTSMQEKRLSLGYRTLTLNGQTLKGHEFHYSQFINNPDPAANPATPPNATAARPAITIHNAYGQEIPAPVFYRRNLFASYMHFYWGESLGPLENWLAG